MANRLDTYKCALCGNIVEYLNVGGGTITCCGQAMEHLAENSVDAATEKHVPVLEKTDKGWLVKVGEVAHPMTDDHSIQWIELIDGERICRKFLKPGDAPEALFCVEASAPTARGYCNLHGLWKG